MEMHDVSKSENESESKIECKSEEGNERQRAKLRYYSDKTFKTFKIMRAFSILKMQILFTFQMKNFESNCIESSF